eukprot:TRINITY_DN4325_c0_g1_i3.p1 TRINITY_DN4325_c0_g1~~TRINITY_DN4325_c0_g1_i3.p1  ORF type:complete len:263 (-),score=46.77 TRINITY_DN4325_c0_g1_i3:72-860(-)
MGGGTLLLNFHSSALLGFFDNGNHAYTHVIQTSLKSHKSHSDVCCKYKSNKKRKPLRDTNPPFLTTRAIGKREKESNLLQNSTNFDFKDKIDVKGNTSYKVKGDEESLSYDQQRADVMKACITTSGAFTVASLIIRQVSHVVSEEGLPFPDCAQIMPYSIGLPQPEILLALVLMISSSRQLLLLFWSEFSESSQTANQMNRSMFLGKTPSILTYMMNTRCCLGNKAPTLNNLTSQQLAVVIHLDVSCFFSGSFCPDMSKQRE